jgi:hypothetical protein
MTESSNGRVRESLNAEDRTKIRVLPDPTSDRQA